MPEVGAGGGVGRVSSASLSELRRKGVVSGCVGGVSSASDVEGRRTRLRFAGGASGSERREGGRTQVGSYLSGSSGT